MDTTPNNSQLPEESGVDSEVDGSSRLRELISNVPWGKVVLAIFALFLLIWLLIYLFGGRGTSAPVQPITDSVAVGALEQGATTRGAMNATAKLGSADYNSVLQPYFSLDANPAYSQSDSRVALLQALNTLESAIDYDVLSYLAGASNREQALNAYEQKLTSTRSTAQQLVDGLTRDLEQTKLAFAVADTEVKEALVVLNNNLEQQASSSDVTAAYQVYQKNIEVRTSITVHQGLLSDVIKLAAPLFGRADKRLNNIQLNRQALIDNVQVVDTDDPGLILIRRQ
ncbi:hypothetical protein KBB08_02425 [Candidatus Gracilibacteria bacterium]|nr:hypothetical protein [Candidatus Gracilibacteria bacterium]